jgi:selenium metabolism protein YedF
MNGSLRTIDARGLACPQPVVLTKKALEEGGFDVLEILVNSPSARENVMRFANHAGHRLEGMKDEGDVSTIRILRNADASLAGTALADATLTEISSCGESESVDAKAPDAKAASTLFISSDSIGSGDDELGALLMRGFLATLVEASPLPERIILMNGGVRLAVEGSAALAKLLKLAEGGVEILACGTCLDFYKITDKLAVGRISNMFEISGLLLRGSTFSL